MPRILLLCFVHGFKGDDNSFQTFPIDLKDAVAALVPHHARVETVIYPRYETKGELAAASQKFLEWLIARVIDLLKANLAVPWPPNDRQVGVVLVAHSMGGFVAANALCLALDEYRSRVIDTGSEPFPDRRVLFPPIQGLLALDTPFNGLSRSMFVHGAFSNYSKMQTVLNVFTAAVAGPMALGRLALSHVAGQSSRPRSSYSSSSSTAAWEMWQIVAVRTGTVGAIAAGGVAAYKHRRTILAGVDHLRRKWRGEDAQVDGATQEFVSQSGANASGSEARNERRPSLQESYRSGVDAIGQGLAQFSRRNVGASFAWLSAHFTFVGALLKQDELNQRLQRLAGLRGGLGVRNLYVSLGANDWNGGYFLPERTFCAVPKRSNGRKVDKNSEKGELGDVGDPASIFERWTMRSCNDEVQAHMSMFKRDKNTDYDAMTKRAAELVAGWFASNDPIVDTVGPPRVAESGAAGDTAAACTTQEDAIRVTDEGIEIARAGHMGRGGEQFRVPYCD